MARLRFSINDKLSAEEKLLRMREEELIKKEAALKQRLKQIPAQVQARKRRDHEMVKHRAVLAPDAISLGGASSVRSRSRSPVRRRTRVGEIQRARIKFFILCMILGAIVLLVLNSIPKG